LKSQGKVNEMVNEGGLLAEGLARPGGGNLVGSRKGDEVTEGREDILEAGRIWRERKHFLRS